MKIISKFKDYYDFVANQYGGGDPRVIYARRPVTDMNEYGFYYNRIVPVHGAHSIYFPNSNKYQFKYVCVMNTLYLMYREILVSSEFKLYDPEDDFLKLISRRPDSFLFMRGEFKFPTIAPVMEQVAKELNAPVFIVDSIRFDRLTNTTYFTIEGAIPNLGELGLAKYVNPYQMYQNLAFFVGNILTNNPETVTIDNVTRLEQHGFDRRVSFRHRG